MDSFSVQNLAFYLIPWIVFGIIHSIFASNSMKSRLPLDKTHYRLIYTATNSLTFLLILLFVPSPIDPVLTFLDLNITVQLIAGLLFALGSAIASWGLSAWDLEAFIGVKEETDQLNTTGPYLISRHPVYTGIILVLISLVVMEFSPATISWLLGAGGYFLIGSRYEENKLVSNFGSRYLVYQKQVGWIFPFQVQHFRNMVQGLDLDGYMDD